MGVRACRLPAFKRLKRLKSFLACPTLQAKATPRPHQWLLIWAFKPAVCQQFSWHAQPRRHKLPQGPRPRQCLLMGARACLLPGVKRLNRLKIFLACPTPQAQATPRPDQWLLMDVQACRLLGLKRLKPLKRLNILLACPTPQATGTPRPHQ